MTGSQYNSIIQWTLMDKPQDDAADSLQVVRDILQNCGVSLPEGGESDILPALMSDNYMGWRACVFSAAQELADQGVPVIGISTGRTILLKPEDSALSVKSTLAVPAAGGDAVRIADAVDLNERLDMQFFAYTAAATTTPVIRAMKIYLSPALHTNDNRCSYDPSCGENIHCNAYMDYVEKFLKGFGFSVRRGNRHSYGDAELVRRVAEANAWPADLYYVCHTNALNNGAYHGSRIFVGPNDAKAMRWANTLVQWRKLAYYDSDALKISAKSDLKEINTTKMSCVYDEIVFHDNEIDAAYLHCNYHELGLHTAYAIRDIYDKNI